MSGDLTAVHGSNREQLTKDVLRTIERDVRNFNWNFVNFVPGDDGFLQLRQVDLSSSTDVLIQLTNGRLVLVQGPDDEEEKDCGVFASACFPEDDDPPPLRVFYNKRELIQYMGSS